MTLFSLKILATTALLGAVTAFAGSSAFAATAKSACSDEYQAAKTAGTLNGQKWPQFLSACTARLKAAPAATDASAATTTTTTKKKTTTTAAAPAAATTTSTAAPANAAASATANATGKKAPTANQIAAHARIKECGVEWKAAKAAGTLPAGEKWPQYWSACNQRLKAQG